MALFWWIQEEINYQENAELLNALGDLPGNKLPKEEECQSDKKEGSEGGLRSFWQWITRSSRSS